MKEAKPRTYGYNKEYAKKYMSKLAEIKIRMSPEEKSRILTAAETAGESVNQYILTATQTRMDNERKEG